MLVGIRPTLARISRWGIAPVTLDHDMAGPMARTVTDAAIMLGAMEGQEADPNDPATQVCAAPEGGDYTQFLHPDGLLGARIGIPRAFYYEPVSVGNYLLGGLNQEQEALMEDAVAALEAAGATVVDPVEIPKLRRPRPGGELQCLGALHRGASGEGCRRRLLCELQVRNETRLRCMAGDARAHGPGQDADGTPQLEPGTPSRRSHEV